MKSEVSIAEAAVLVQRSKRTVYRWVDDGLLVAFETSEGLKVSTASVLAVAGESRLGRPRKVDAS